MPRQITGFWVSADAQEHMLRKHGVTPDEALEAAQSSPAYRAARAVGCGSSSPTRATDGRGSSPQESRTTGPTAHATGA